jgi:hypothetical protein
MNHTNPVTGRTGQQDGQTIGDQNRDRLVYLRRHGGVRLRRFVTIPVVFRQHNTIAVNLVEPQWLSR